MDYSNFKNLYYPRKSIIMAYSYLEKSTPLDFDCGTLCSGKCCKGDDVTGMILFPYEKELLKHVKDFTITSNDGRDFLVCDGKCDREKRPLACRMYPLFPLVYFEDDKVKFKIIRDPRAIGCPIVSKHLKISNSFKKSLSMATRHLLNDELTKKHLLSLSEEIMDIIKMNDILKSSTEE